MPTHDRDMLTAVVEAAQNGDVAAYGNLVEKTQRLIGDTVRRLIHDPDDAEDAVQDTYLRAYRQLDSLRHPQAAIPWLQRIARSVSLNQQRARRLSFVDADVSELAAAEPVHPSGSATDDASLQQALVLLSPEERRLCERYYYGGWPTARLADDMALSEAAVRKRMQRIRDRLREEMTMGESALPEKIVELLSRPNLTALPDNPVGAIWSEFQTAFTGFDEVELPERLEREALAELFGDADPEALRCYLGSLERQDWLRSDLTKPMLLAARGTPGAARHIATGKTYRLGDDESQAKLHAFHQAEALWIEEGLDEWGLMSPMTAFLDRLGIRSFLAQLPGLGLPANEVEKNRMPMLWLARPDGLGRFKVAFHSRGVEARSPIGLDGRGSGHDASLLPPVTLPDDDTHFDLAGGYTGASTEFTATWAELLGQDDEGR